MRSYILVAILACSGCSESDDGTTTPNGTKDSGAPIDSSTTDSTASSDTNVTPSDTPPPSGKIAINEVRTSNGDFMEFMNVSTTTVDMSGFAIQNTDSDGGLVTAFTFPDGVSVPAGGYVLVYADDKVDSGVSTMCMGAPVTNCYYAPFGISNKRGETLKLLDKGMAVVDTVDTPADLAGTVTWSRLPNGTGSFAQGAPTPGAENKAM